MNAQEVIAHLSHYVTAQFLLIYNARVALWGDLLSMLSLQ